MLAMNPAYRILFLHPLSEPGFDKPPCRFSYLCWNLTFLARLSFCREFTLSDAPETRMNRGGDFSNIYKRDHFVECVGGTGGFCLETWLHRGYFVRLPPGLSTASTHHGRAQESVHLCNERGPWELPASCQGGGVDTRRTPDRREKLSDGLSRASSVASAPTGSLRRRYSSGGLLLRGRAECAARNSASILDAMGILPCDTGRPAQTGVPVPRP